MKFLVYTLKRIQHLSMSNLIPVNTSLRTRINTMIFFDISIFYILQNLIVRQISSLLFYLANRTLLPLLYLQVNYVYNASLKFIILDKNQMKNDSEYLIKCCVCYSQNCQESVDHFPYSFHELKELIDECMTNKKVIGSLKNSITQTYNNIRDTFLVKLQEDQRKFQQWVNQFYFTHLADSINKSLLSQLAQHNYQQLPNKSLSKLIKSLKRSKRQCKGEVDLPSSFYEARKFIERIDADSVSDKTIRMLAQERVIKSSEVSMLSLCSKRSISEINPQQFEYIPQAYQWKNVKLNKNSRTVQLSNKNLKDQDLIKQIPQISAFKNIKQFEIRNNFITALSCKIIVNNLKFISSLDIRGNKIGDIGLEYIIKGMPQLKSLLISQTGATDQSGHLIVTHLQNLQLFWGQYNQFTGEVALSIGSKPKLKVMSVVGNPIDKKYSSILHGVFSRKGYVVV